MKLWSLATMPMFTARLLMFGRGKKHMNDLAPEKELRVALRVLYRATSHCRHLALNPATPHRQIEDLYLRLLADATGHLAK
jgi:hypothetical protein